jgi:hypothetical protein
MENISVGGERGRRTDSHVDGRSGKVLAFGEQALRRAISDHPGTALIVSAALGVILACLIKRR